jgi:hypothetical protein
LSVPDKYFVQHVHAVEFEVSTSTARKFWFCHEAQTFLIVDEAQDLRKAQWSRLKTIAPRKSLTIIFCTSEPETHRAKFGGPLHACAFGTPKPA